MSCPCLKPPVTSSKPRPDLHSPVIGSSFPSSLITSHAAPCTSCSRHSDLLLALTVPGSPSTQALCISCSFCLDSSSSTYTLPPRESPPRWVSCHTSPALTHHTVNCCAMSVSSRKAELALFTNTSPKPSTQLLNEWLKTTALEHRRAAQA